MDDSELDDILENALLDFEQEEAKQKSTKEQTHIEEEIKNNFRPNISASTSSNISSNEGINSPNLTEEQMVAQALARLKLDSADDADFDFDKVLENISDGERQMLDKFANDMSQFLKGLNEDEPKPPTTESSSSSNTEGRKKTFQETIDETVNMLKQNTDELNNLSSQNKGGPNPLGSEFLGEFEKLFQGEANEEGGEDRMHGILENIMQTLMSPDILKQPMEELRREYPLWLKENEGKADPAEIERIKKQYEYADKICKVYETSTFPECLPVLIDLMKDMQTYGSPPDEIVKKMSDGKGGAGILPDMNGCPMQ
ncbi:peroxisome biogenesis protein [Acrasis kona]|uniref:Peroxisome biogenesis protein n=1 Tax=Acrasis kona TaxID=1008807 RepID=A0AAW2YPP5_9EUKA